MLKKALVLCLAVLVPSASVTMADPLAVELHIHNRNVLMSEPVSLRVVVRNLGSVPVSLAPLSAVGESPNVTFEVVSGTERYPVVNPLLVLEHAEGNHQRTTTAIHTGQTLAESFILGIDWASETPIFRVGTNWLACTVVTLSGVEVQSEKQLVLVSPPKNGDEEEVQRLLSDRDVLRSVYATDYLLLTGQPRKVVASMKRMAALNHSMAEIARKTLNDWKRYEDNALAGYGNLSGTFARKNDVSTNTVSEMNYQIDN